MGFSLDRDQNRSAFGTGALSGAVGGFATGASIGAAAGGGVASVPAALIGGLIGAVAAGSATGGAAALSDKQAQQDAYTAKQAELAAKQSAQVDATAAAREGSVMPASVRNYAGDSVGASGYGLTGYDRWKTGG